jgi:pectin methylesterase-like acyl-CoA thioesterase
MMKNYVIIHLALFALLWRTDGSPAKTIRVSQDGNSNFRSIQAAVSSASPGDTIKVTSGVYDEKVELLERSGLDNSGAPVASGVYFY